MNLFLFRLMFAGLISLVLSAQVSPSGARKIKLVLERLDDKTWKPVDPGLVLNSGDKVRFRMESNLKGFLYVMNYDSSGKYSVLFPSAELGSDNQIKPGQVRHIPREEDVFRIAGPAGQEVIYWVVSPVSLPGYGTPPTAPRTPLQLSPRCDDTLLRARGECIDSTAGARGIDVEGDLPTPIKPKSRPSDLVFLREDNQSVVATKDGSSAPIVYEFRISHH